MALKLDRKKFYDHVRISVFGGRLLPLQVDGMENLLDVQEKYLPDIAVDELGYDLATSYHETGASMQPITERGARSYFDQYEPGTKKGRMLGNTVKGDGFRYRGEGHVMNTGRRNAAYATTQLNKKFNLGIDLIAHPELRGDPKISALSLFLGNREGWWTGKDLSDFLDGVDESDAEDLREFVNARRVVNGTDKAEKIGRYALGFEKAIRGALVQA